MIPELKEILMDSNEELLIDLAKDIDTLDDVYNLIEKSIVDNPPISTREGGLIKSNYNDGLDELRNVSTEGKNWLAKLEQSEKEKTGIRNLKIGFNKKNLGISLR